ncbi:MAG: hypothetical protein L3K03_02760 [Thermoplasmata archaeon]|nr:hypothetical protein [Thermoplasmata archaeon]
MAMSGLPSRDPLEEFAAGLARGSFEAAGPTVKEYAALPINRRLALIGRRDYILEVKAQRQSAEWLLFREYIRDKRLSILAQMGLTLRDWESDPAHARDIDRLRNGIHQKHGEEGVHIAQVVQSRVLTGVVPAVLGTVSSKERAAGLIEAFLDKSFQLCKFVQEKDSVGALGRAIGDHLTMNRPPLFVLFARGSAITTCSKIVKQLMESRHDYQLQVQDLYGSRIAVLVRTDLHVASPRF